MLTDLENRDGAFMRPARFGAISMLAIILPPALEADVIGGWAEGFEHEFSGDVTLAGFIGDDAANGASSVVAEAGLDLETSTFLENGTKFGLRLGLRGKFDSDDRVAFGGEAGSCPALVADCNFSPGPGGLKSVRSMSNGWTSGNAQGESGAYMAMENAHLFMSGGWGEVVFGQDQGVAKRFEVSVPHPLRTIRASSSSLDPSGYAFIRTVNDYTGPSAKISYSSPRILGVKLGTSYTPKAYTKGVDWAQRDNEISTPANYEVEHAVELVASLRRKLPMGPEIEASLSHTLANDGSDRAGFETLHATGIGMILSQKGFSLGGMMHRSNNGWNKGFASNENRQYVSYHIGGAYEWDKWRVAADFAKGDDNLTKFKAYSASFGVSRAFNQGFTVRAAVYGQEFDIPTINLGARDSDTKTTLGGIVEISYDF